MPWLKIRGGKAQLASIVLDTSQAEAAPQLGHRDSITLKSEPKRAQREQVSLAMFPNLLYPAKPGARSKPLAATGKVSNLALGMADDGIELGHSLGTVGDVKLFEHALHVIFDGEGADVQNGTDLGVGLSLRHPVEDLHFAFGEVVLFDEMLGHADTLADEFVRALGQSGQGAACHQFWR